MTPVWGVVDVIREIYQWCQARITFPGHDDTRATHYCSLHYCHWIWHYWKNNHITDKGALHKLAIYLQFINLGLYMHCSWDRGIVQKPDSILVFFFSILVISDVTNENNFLENNLRSYSVLHSHFKKTSLLLWTSNQTVERSKDLSCQSNMTSSGIIMTKIVISKVSKQVLGRCISINFQCTPWGLYKTKRAKINVTS